MGLEILSYRNVIKDIQQGIRKPIYVLYGSQTFLIEEMIKFMVEKWIDESSRDFNITSLSLAEEPLERLMMDAETYPFMSKHRLCIGTNALFLTGSKLPGKLEHNTDMLTDYINNPPDFTSLIFTVMTEKLDERKKIVKLLQEKGEVVPFLPFKDIELQQWISRRAKTHKAEIAPEAVQLLQDNVGDQLQLLDQELKKCSVFVGENGTITADVIRNLVVFSIEQNIFVLIEEVAKLRIEEALRILYDLLRNKEEPIKIISLLARQFRNMLLVKDLTSRGYTSGQIASTLKLHPYAVKIATGQATIFQEPQLRTILQRLATLDYEMKSGQVDKVLGLEMFILSLKQYGH